MRPVFGLTESDKSILRALDYCGFAIKPSTIKYNLETRFDDTYSTNTIGRRLKHLRHAGLVDLEDEDGSRYAITELGERLLEKDLTDEEVMEISQLLQEGPDN